MSALWAGIKARWRWLLVIAAPIVAAAFWYAFRPRTRRVSVARMAEKLHESQVRKWAKLRQVDREVEEKLVEVTKKFEARTDAAELKAERERQLLQGTPESMWLWVDERTRELGLEP